MLCRVRNTMRHDGFGPRSITALPPNVDDVVSATRITTRHSAAASCQVVSGRASSPKSEVVNAEFATALVHLRQHPWAPNPPVSQGIRGSPGRWNPAGAWDFCLDGLMEAVVVKEQVRRLLPPGSTCARRGGKRSADAS